MRKTMCVVAAVLSALCFSSVASADVIGQTGGNTGCGGDQLLVQSTSTGPSYVMPANGVVSSWSFDGSTSGNTEALVILRPLGGGDYMIVGSAAPQTVAASTIGTFATSIPVQAGDLVGEWIPSAGTLQCAQITSSADVLDHNFGVTSLPNAGDNVTLFVAAGFLLNMAVQFDPAGGAAQVNRAGYCSAPGNTSSDGKTLAAGTFLDLAVGQPTNDPRYTGATPAYFYQGLGISCDNLPGYTKTSELVGMGGHGDPGAYTYMAKN